MIQTIHFRHDEALEKDSPQRHLAICFDELHNETVIKDCTSIGLVRKLEKAGVDLNEFETSDPIGEGWQCFYNAFRRSS